jgi:diguanylate cyclase (GGDEF)-like protein
MIKELEQTQLRLKHLALHDSLTDLPNRNLFYDHLNKSVARAKRQEGMLAVLFIDLDEFKNINDKLGHSVGDLMLLSVAKRLTECIRESDIVARMGGDEFTIILDDVNSVDDTAMVAEKILEAMSVPFVLEGNKISITASIGISVYPNDSSDKDALMKNSDTAMYMAKEKGKNNYRFFLSELNENIFNKIDIQKERV